jgi:hypothetical protein
MNAQRLFNVAAYAVLLLAPACGQPRTPDASNGGDADAGELSCDEKARAQGLCRAALRQRCDAQSNDCELNCETHGNLPETTKNMPSERTDMEITRCRQNCEHGHDGCVVTVEQRCPALCE